MMKRFLLACLLSTHFIAALANFCPTNLMQDHEGYWISHQAPGWKSATPTPTKISINTNDFGGAHYSPTQHRLVCLFRKSNGGWLAIVSHRSRLIQIDRHARDSTGRLLAWKKDLQYLDFSCESSHQLGRRGCRFEILQ